MTTARPTFGFHARFELHRPLTEDEETAVTDAFLALAAARGLVTSGGFSGTRFAHVVFSDAGQVTEADRAAVERWAATRPEIRTADVGPVVALDG